MASMAEHGAKLFEAAAERMRLNTGLQLSNEQKLELYGYYKQVIYSGYITIDMYRPLRALVTPVNPVFLISLVERNGMMA